MNIAVYGRQFNDASVFPFIRQVFENLVMHQVNVYLHPQFADTLKGNLDTAPYHILDSNQPIKDFIDLFITIGGDGTMLDMVTLIRDTGVPVIGINFGRLGFLASINRNDIAAAIHAVVNKEYTIDSRELLVIDSEQNLFGDNNFALNDVTIHKRDDAAMITTHVSLNGEFLNSYWGDGIIISTSTGSTAYSLSCGGPIIFPQSNSIALTPVAPHNLNVRPVILPDTSELSFEVECRGTNYIVSCDSRTIIIDKSVPFKVYKADFKLNLIRLNNESYLSTLRKKLLWGLDARNY
ncbi:NAD kinase [Mucilaginibacter pallidiroseus]|uniref:NAD kinase n=1 Tax=Mucilaginibacter pallidiroseus TaxID=2599295 RepID=A0A563U334_9SPHI|nr:NAD kinase [Mucilaginibacter pallidiroseus]TWR25757.1 NAD kinase [Mucilaginibacter pallidiroseus]